MASTPNSQLAKLVIGMASVALIAGVTGRLANGTKLADGAEEPTGMSEGTGSASTWANRAGRDDDDEWDDDDDDDWDDDDDHERRGRHDDGLFGFLFGSDDDAHAASQSTRSSRS